MSPTILSSRLFRPATISVRNTPAISGRKRASIATASHSASSGQASSSRPASHSAASAASGGPDTGIRPVQFGTAVIRNPAKAAEAKPNSISCMCQLAAP